MRGKKPITFASIIILLLSQAAFVQQTKSDETCIGWPMFGRTPDQCHWVPPECSPKSADYELEWSYDLTDYVLLRKVLVVGNRVLTNSYSGKLYSFMANPGDPKGKLMWSYDMKSPIKTPCYDNGRLYLCMESGVVQCIDFASKNLLWTKTLTGFIDTHPVVYRNKLYVDASDSPNILSSKNCYFNCIDASSGETIWSTNYMGRLFSTPAFSDKYMVVGTDNGSLYCFDITRKSGPPDNVVWHLPLGFKVYTPAIRNGKVYAIVRNKDGSFEFDCFNLADGSSVWSYKTQKNAEYYDYVTVNDKYFVCDTLAGFECLDAMTGKEVWHNSELGVSATMTDDYVFTVTKDEVNCADLQTGKKLWSHKIKTPTLPSSIDRDRIYLMGDNTVYCFKLKKPTYPELVDIGDVGDPGSGIIKPEKIAISPGVTYLEPGHTQKFEATVIGTDGKVVKAENLVWEVEGKIGTMDTDGVFTAKTVGDTKITCKCGDAVGTADVHVVKFLSANPSKIEFRNVQIGSKPFVSVKLTALYLKYLTVSLSVPNEKIKLSSDSLRIDAGQSETMEVSLDTSTLTPGEVFETVIKATYDGGSIDIPVTVTVSNDRMDCFAVQPKNLDFGFVERGVTKSLKLNVICGRKTRIFLKPSNNWITLSTNDYVSDGLPKEIEVAIQTSSLPKGESFMGSIQITDDTGVCNMISVPVSIETQNGIILELTVDSAQAYLNKKPLTMDAPARIINGRTMVPIRFISEAFGCKVEWDAKEGKITIIRHDMTIRLWKGKTTAKVNDDEKILDSPPQIIKGRTFVPLRFISEPFGAKVIWDKATKKITIIWDPL